MAASIGKRLRDELARAADPSRAPAMQAYMKSTMPYLGCSATVMRAVCRSVFAAHAVDDEAKWRDDVLSLFRGAKFREERYGALELAGDLRARPFRTLAALPMYEEMIVTGAWWDYVDHLAAHRLGELLQKHPAAMKKTMLAWSRDDDLWKRRSSILCQLRFKEKTDLPLLYACIEPSIERKEFFLRKAIGWALRQYARTDPREVLRYVRERRAQLSPLSKREALKNVVKSGLIAKIP